MASSVQFLFIVLFTAFVSCCFGSRKLTELVSEQTQLLRYHDGPLLYGSISINLIWYGKFKPSQRAIVTDFVTSLTPNHQSNSKQIQPSIADWWKTIDKYSKQISNKKSLPKLNFTLGEQITDETYSLGKRLSDNQLINLASRGRQSYAINVVLTSNDVVVDKFCTSRCGTHGSSKGTKPGNKYAYIWVGNSETQCPGQCAWPFHQPIYGPQTTPLIAPNNDVGMDGLVINLATLLAGTATNPFGNGYFQGPVEAPLEAASACPGVYGSGAYPGYAGNLLVDELTGASYNARGLTGRKYLVPALYDPTISACSTLV